MGKIHIFVSASMLFMFPACTSTPTSNNNTDQEALLALKAAITNDPQNLLAHNWTTNTSFCNWVGITCSNHRGRVTELNISGMGLRFSLSFNYFVGAIPEEVGHLPMLRILFLGVNNLTGHIPQSIFNMTSVQNIDFSYNSLSGNNFFSSSIKMNIAGDSHHYTSICGWKSNFLLIIIPLAGTIPSQVVNLPNLYHLFLQYNNLTGPIPASVFNISTLVRISLDGNSLSGFLPKTIGNYLRDLQLLFLQDNFMSNDPSSPELEFFTSLANCRALKKLCLDSNLFRGILPRSIGNLTSNLTDLIMDNNKLVGNIPSELGNLSGLINLSLRENNLNGAVPATVASMRNLQLLDLFSNQLSGSIPADLCYARSLSEVNMQWNNLSGAIPECIGLLTSLRILVLDSNALSSSIPLSLWGLKDLLVLTLSFNSLNGSLPLQVGQMAALRKLNLSGNHLSGNIPSTLGKLQRLETLSLSNNKFEAAIPESFGSLTSLTALDLSYNNLSGKIPKSLENIVSLRYFNVSFNKLEGEIPNSGGFANFTTRSFMSNKALCGPPRLQVLPCGSEPHGHSKTTKSILLRLVLPTAGSLVLVVAASILLLKIYQIRQTIVPSEEAASPLATPRRISYLDLMRATNKLQESNLLGKGSFGSVYQGILQDGRNIAVKVFDLQLHEAFRSFDTECEILRNIRQLVKIICSCSNPEFKALVLHYMPNGSLEKWLYSHNYCLTIIQRLNIMIDYLHHGNPTCVVHCDLKPSNVLLDNDMVAHVCDFGIGKLLGESEPSVQTKTLATIGYMAPGTIPSHVMNVPNLQHLMLQYNNLTGHIPASVFNISTLVRISLDTNTLSGFLPTTVGNLRALQVLFLQNNFLSNDPSNPELDFFTSLANCRALIRLRLENNLFSGILPQSIGNLTSNLTDIVMDNNKLVGNIPSELGNLSGLIRLSLSGNNLSGPIPATVARMENLQHMDLSSNKLNGSIPVDICYARSISEVNLQENKLSGALPDCIGLLTSLRNFVLDSNALTSSIPLSLWGLKDLLILSLSFNSLNGSLPDQVGEMTALLQLNLSGNHLFDDIPSSLGKLESLQFLSLSNNKFQGAIPESFGNMKDLTVLDLSHNNLSGKIPKSLEELESLRDLNVSFNELEGEIPSSGSFTNFTGTSYMGNKALCGPPRLQVPLCGSESYGQSKSTKAVLLKFVPPAASVMLVVAAFISLKIYQRKLRVIPNEEAPPLGTPRRISYLELMRATINLHESNLLGKGSFGSVYQGILQDGKSIAVKLQGAFRSFDTECEILRNIRHRNLVKIICSCSNPDFKALVLHYMPNGSLEKRLYSHNYCLTIIQRLNIMIDVASALEYLHHGNPTCVVHCDLKPSNNMAWTELCLQRLMFIVLEYCYWKFSLEESPQMKCLMEG
ncbi:hypothetical protein Tsubulata_043674 [Turnera subulata]|uniref:Protein kinase domain-containing protein n=1 Tax=Turnera subulata TaxID=218843 RepID=A0A9Q0FHP2_9ROSI|nr:hypothetical protein Tsubulata_043674 [Turnera subulata]